MTYLWSNPGYFREPHWVFSGTPGNIQGILTGMGWLVLLNHTVCTHPVLSKHDSLRFTTASHLKLFSRNKFCWPSSVHCEYQQHMLCWYLWISAYVHIYLTNNNSKWYYQLCSVLVPVMSCLFGTKTLPEPVVICDQFEPWQQSIIKS